MKHMPLKPSYPKEKRILWYLGVDRDKKAEGLKKEKEVKTKNNFQNKKY